MSANCEALVGSCQTRSGWNHNLGRLLQTLVLASLSLLSQQSQAAADSADESFLPYAASIHLSSATKSWTGYGIYLGNGLFITAAHVVGRAWMTNPRIVLAGREYPTRIIKEGSFEATDLTLMAVDEKILPLRLSLRRTRLCSAPSRPGQQIVTVVPEGVVRSHIIGPEQLPIGARKFSTVIADVARTGNSGSGVFDVQHGCLLGIMSRKISRSQIRPDTGKTEARDIAKYFVPASEIAAFLPADLVRQVNQ